MKCISAKLTFGNGDTSELSCQKGLLLDDIHEFVNAKCNPAEPLIKDEKIRKAVRAWAEANGLLEELRVINEHFDCFRVIGRSVARNICHHIEFETTIANADEDRYYTIDELCGEEK